MEGHKMPQAQNTGQRHNTGQHVEIQVFIIQDHILSTACKFAGPRGCRYINMNRSQPFRSRRGYKLDTQKRRFTVAIAASWLEKLKFVAHTRISDLKGPF